MRRLQSFKTQKSPVRVDRSDLDEEGQLLGVRQSLLNPDNVSSEDVVIPNDVEDPASFLAAHDTMDPIDSLPRNMRVVPRRSH